MVRAEYHASTADVAWLITGYLLASAVTTPLIGRLGDMFGRQRVMVLVLTVVAGGTLVSAAAPTLPILVIGRVIQGVGGATFPLAFGIVRQELPRRTVPMGIGFVSAVYGVGSGLGIVAAGPIIDHLSYRWIFWFAFILLAIAVVTTRAVIPGRRAERRERIDWLGALLLGGAVGGLLLALHAASASGWLSVPVLALSGAAAVLLATWYSFERRIAEPLVDIAMLRLRSVWATNLAGLLLGFGTFGSFILVPQLVELPHTVARGLGGTATEASLVLLPFFVATLLTGLAAGALAPRFGSKVLLLTGLALTVASFTSMSLEHGALSWLAVGNGGLGAGFGLALASMANLIVEAVASHRASVAMSVNTISRQIGGAFGSQVSAAIIVGSTIGPSQPPTASGFTVAFAVLAGVTLLACASAAAIPGGTWDKAVGLPPL